LLHLQLTIQLIRLNKRYRFICDVQMEMYKTENHLINYGKAEEVLFNRTGNVKVYQGHKYIVNVIRSIVTFVLQKSMKTRLTSFAIEQ